MHPQRRLDHSTIALREPSYVTLFSLAVAVLAPQPLIFHRQRRKRSLVIIFLINAPHCPRAYNGGIGTYRVLIKSPCVKRSVNLKAKFRGLFVVNERSKINIISG